MKRIAGAAFAFHAVICSDTAVSAETTTYTYNALGRLTNMSVSSGVANGVQQAFSYDGSGNVKSQQTLGPLNPRPVTITPTSAVGLTGTAATLSVALSGASPGGTVSFRLGEQYVGSAVISSGRASIRVTGLTPGTYTVTVTYAGDASNDPKTFTYTTTVRDISWLPAILNLLLQN